jgi:hypothetical protein
MTGVNKERANFGWLSSRIKFACISL